MFRRTRARSVLPAGAILLSAAVLATGCSGGSAGSGSNAQVTIKAVLPPNTGPITAADNAGLKQPGFGKRPCWICQIRISVGGHRKRLNVVGALTYG
jgi:hypothetical protein